SPWSQSVAKRLASLEHVLQSVLGFLGAKERQELFAFEIEQILFGDFARRSVTTAQHIRHRAAHAQVVHRRLSGLTGGPQRVLKVAKALSAKRTHAQRCGRDIVGCEIDYTLTRVREQMIAIHADAILRTQEAHRAGIQRTRARGGERDEFERALERLE